MKILPLQLKHTAELYSLVEVSRQDLTNLAWSKTATFESTAQFIANQGKDKHFGIFLKEETMAGCIGLWQQSDHLSLGYWLGTPYRGHGVMKTVLTRFLWDHVQKYFERQEIRVKIREENIKSLKVVEGAGFKRTGIAEDEHYTWILLSWDKYL